MGEMVQLNFGDVGNYIGHQYLEKLINDHYLNENNNPINTQYTQKIHVSFEELRNQQYQFRGIFDNSSDQFTNQLLTSPECQYINMDLLLSKRNTNITGTFSNSENYYRDQVQDELFEKLRQHIERCDKLFGCNFNHATYDNSSGQSALSITQYRERYPDKFCSAFSLIPNIVSASTIQIYNTGFSMHHLVENSDIVMLFDYGALEKQLQKLNQLCTIQNCNKIVAECILQMNCSQRFPGHQNGDFRKIATNLNPFPRLHFLTCAFTPFQINSDWNQLKKLSIPENTYLTFHNITTNLYFTQALITRCNTNNLEFHKQLSNLDNKIDWLPDGILHLNCKVENRNLGKTVMHIGNHRELGISFQAHSDLFSRNYGRKTYIHYYCQDGMDEMEFVEAESNLNDFVSEYQEYCSPVQYDEEEYYEESEEYN